MLHDAIEEPLTSEEPLFHKMLFVVEDASDYKKVRKSWFTEPWTE